MLKFLLGRADAGNIFDSNGTVPPVQSNNECRHRICMTEVAPSHSSIFGTGKFMLMSIIVYNTCNCNAGVCVTVCILSLGKQYVCTYCTCLVTCT